MTEPEEVIEKIAAVSEAIGTVLCSNCTTAAANVIADDGKGGL